MVSGSRPVIPVLVPTRPDICHGWLSGSGTSHGWRAYPETRLGQPAAKKHGAASAGLTRQCDTHLEKTRKYLPAVARLQAGRSFRASLQANSQTLGSPPPRVGGVAATATLSVVVACKLPVDSLPNSGISGVRFNLELLKFANEKIELFRKNS